MTADGIPDLVSLETPGSHNIRVRLNGEPMGGVIEAQRGEDGWILQRQLSHGDRPVDIGPPRRIGGNVTFEWME